LPPALTAKLATDTPTDGVHLVTPQEAPIKQSLGNLRRHAFPDRTAQQTQRIPQELAERCSGPITPKKGDQPCDGDEVARPKTMHGPKRASEL